MQNQFMLQLTSCRNFSQQKALLTWGSGNRILRYWLLFYLCNKHSGQIQFWQLELWRDINKGNIPSIHGRSMKAYSRKNETSIKKCQLYKFIVTRKQSSCWAFSSWKRCIYERIILLLYFVWNWCLAVSRNKITERNHGNRALEKLFWILEPYTGKIDSTYERFRERKLKPWLIQKIVIVHQTWDLQACFEV